MCDLDPERYTVAWIAPLEIEAQAALHMLDHRHLGGFRMRRGDDYLYKAGEMCGHNVIIAMLPAGQEYGNGSAAAIASQIKSFFPNLWFGLLVGVAAGLPNLSQSPPVDIRLGDVLVGLGKDDSAGLIAYDLGKETAQAGFQPLLAGHVLTRTETVVRSAIGSIKLLAPNDAMEAIPHYESMKNKEHSIGTFADPGQERDLLYQVDSDGNESLIERKRRPDNKRTRVWYGPIGSGDKLMKNARKRNELRDKYNLIGLEMEAAGTMNRIPVGVIRGVCDYGDEHKNKEWQPYAAAMAAAYAKALLLQIRPETTFPVNAPRTIATNDRVKKRQLEEECPASISDDRHKKRRCWEGVAEASRDSNDVAQFRAHGRGIQASRDILDEGGGLVSFAPDDNNRSLKDLQMTDRQLDEPSTFPHITFNSTERLKNLRSQSSSVLSRHDPNFLDPKSHCYSEYSVHGENPLETRKEQVMSISDNIDATTKESLKSQLYFTKIDERLTGLTAAQGTTCRWFLTKPEYKSWHDLAQQPNHGGFLWIKGHPGTGKSTLMKFLFEDAKLKAKGDCSRITVSFFFLARGTVEEKSTTGLYRSLLHQLFEKVVGLTDCLEWMTTGIAKVIQRNGWNEEALKQTLIDAVQKLGSRSLTIFVDALDECDQDQVTSMVCFFEELCDRAKEKHVRLQICFSSRHYPAVVIQKGIEVILESEMGHTEDIKQYIKSKLRLGRLKQAELLRTEILEKSSGIFLWVVLALDILSSEYPNSLISIKKIRERLKEIPPKLNDLFEMILMRDGENLERLQVCLKWILFAARPLKPQEFYFAIQLSLDTKCSSYWDQEDVELDQMKTFVRSSSKGLAEVTRNKASKVQFIHESVREFLLRKYEGQGSEGSESFVGYSHELLRNCCLAQLNASINQDVDIPDSLPPASQAAQLRETISSKFPFLEYSVLYVLHHANSAQHNAIEQGDFLTDFRLQRWIFLNNALEKFNSQRYPDSASLLYILAEKNLASLIRIHPQRQSCFEVGSERYGPPILAGLTTGGYEAVQVFLEVQAEIHPNKTLLHHLCKQYSEKSNKCSYFGRGFTFSQDRSLSSYVAEQGDELILTFLDALGKLDIESTSKFDNRTPLSFAAEHGHEAVVELLLEKGAGLDNKDKRFGRTPLSWAASCGREAVVELLLEKGAELDFKDSSRRTPLSWATSCGHKAVVELLLEKGAELDSKDSSRRTPLSWAISCGREAVVELLLKKGAELDSKDMMSIRSEYEK